MTNPIRRPSWGRILVAFVMACLTAPMSRMDHGRRIPWWEFWNPHSGLAGGLLGGVLLLLLAVFCESRGMATWPVVGVVLVVSLIACARGLWAFAVMVLHFDEDGADGHAKGRQ